MVVQAYNSSPQGGRGSLEHSEALFCFFGGVSWGGMAVFYFFAFFAVLRLKLSALCVLVKHPTTGAILPHHCFHIGDLFHVWLNCLLLLSIYCNILFWIQRAMDYILRNGSAPH
jgi:hypothetical protein